MNTATAQQIEREERPTIGLVLVDRAPREPSDATQGRQIGSLPYDDATQGRTLDEDPRDDASRARPRGR
jgi:hypothetical protein